MNQESQLDRSVALLEQGIAKDLHLGGQLYVSLRDRVAVDLAVGQARPGEDLNPDHLMIWYSSSKPLTAVAVAQQWERDKLDLDDPVTKHIPEFGTRGKETITIRHLLTHTGGFRTFDVGWPDSAWDEIIARICDLKLEPGWSPGEKAGYHLASSWFILGELVRRLDGRPLDRYLREEILIPSGMTDSWVGMPLERFREYGDRIAPMYDAEAELRRHEWPSEKHFTRCSPAGGGCGPMRELGAFYEMLLAGGEHQGTRILSPDTIETLTSRHRVGLFDHTFRYPLDWGLGFIPNSQDEADDIQPYGYGPHASPKTFGHGGYRSSTGFADPEHGLVVALAVNGTPTEDAHRERFHGITAAIYEDLGLARA